MKNIRKTTPGQRSYLLTRSSSKIPPDTTNCAGAEADHPAFSGLCIWREISAPWAGLRERPRSLDRFGAKSPSSCATIGSGLPAKGRGRGGARRAAASGEKQRSACFQRGTGGPSALGSDGPRGGSGAGRRQPAPGSPRRGGREVPETVPGLLGGVSQRAPLTRGTSPPAPRGFRSPGAPWAPRVFGN